MDVFTAIAVVLIFINVFYTLHVWMKSKVIKKKVEILDGLFESVTELFEKKIADKDKECDDCTQELTDSDVRSAVNTLKSEKYNWKERDAIFDRISSLEKWVEDQGFEWVQPHTVEGHWRKASGKSKK